jgi:UrcA family protein
MTAATVNSNRSTLGRVTVLAACLLAGSLGVARAATPDAGVPQLAVAYGDLNVASDDGARELYQRIAKAAERVCPFSGSRELAQLSVNNRCREAAIARAVREVNSPQLAALRADRARRG